MKPLDLSMSSSDPMERKEDEQVNENGQNEQDIVMPESSEPSTSSDVVITQAMSPGGTEVNITGYFLLLIEII